MTTPSIPQSWLAWLALAICTPVAEISAAPVINEFLASNGLGLQDEDLVRGDWIELYNPDSTPVDLTGWSLTDDAAQLTRWVFPAVTMPANSYLVVFASGKNRRVPGSNLHTNFSLSSGGEYLALVAADGTTIVHDYSSTYPAQTQDVSYGLLTPSPTAEKAYFSTPTPGAVNNPANAPVDPVAFSLPSQTFAQGSSRSLVLTCPTPGATIRYTLDRTVPTSTSTLYSGPITVNYSVRVRAKAFLTGRPESVVTSEAYLALDTNAQNFTSNIPIMIQHSWGSGHPSTTAPTGTQPEDTKLDVLFIFEPKLPDGLARMTNLPDLATPGYFERRGSSTFGETKYSMTMGAFDETNQGKEVSPLGFPSNDDFVLNAPYRYDRSLVHNDLIYKLSNEVGRYAPRTRHVELFHSVANETAASGSIPAYGAINGSVTTGDYFGVYSFQEKISRGNRRLDIEKLETTDNTAPNVQGGYIFKIDRLDNGDLGLAAAGRSAASPTWSYVQPKEFTSYPAHLPVVTTQQRAYLQTVLNAMYTALQSPNFKDPVLGYRAHLDVPACIDHHILSLLPKSADAFRLSGYWHKSRYGKLAMGPIFDFDRAMGSTDGRDLLPTTWRGDVPDLGTDYFHSGSIFTPNYFDWMFDDPKFWQEWIDRLEQLRQGAFATAHVHALVDEYTALLDPNNAASTPAKRNFQRFPELPPRGAGAGTPGTDGTFRGEMAWLKTWWERRLNFVDGQFTRPAIANLTSGPVPAGAQLTLTSPSLARPGAGIVYTTDFSEPSAARVFDRELITESTQIRASVPTADPGSLAWRGLGYDDSAWPAGVAGASPQGVGYDDTRGSATDFLPFFQNGVSLSSATFPVAGAETLRGINSSIYIRYTFQVSAEQLNGLTDLRLSVRYDDGFVAYINGTKMASRNAKATPTWNDSATTSRSDTAAIVYEDIDTKDGVSALVVGTNVLAVHGFNSAINNNDFLFQAKLSGGQLKTLGSSLAYSGPITISQPTQMFIRTYDPATPSDPPTQAGGGTGTVPNGSSWSAPITLYLFPGAEVASGANLAITEIQYNPANPTTAETTAGATGSNNFEFIRLTNIGTTPLDLTGIYFSDGVNFTSGDGLQNWLPVGSSVVIVDNRALYLIRYPNDPAILGEFDGDLANGGERLVLNAKNGDIIADITYGDADPWPAAADEGRSLLYVSGPVGEATSWTASLDPGGTGVASFAVFQQRYFSLSNTPAGSWGANEDPDQDGLNNLIEYAMGSDPLSSESAPRPVVTDGELGYEVLRRKGAADLTYTFQYGSDLAGWTSGNAPIVSPLPGNSGVEKVAWKVPTPIQDRVYMRVLITVE